LASTTPVESAPVHDPVAATISSDTPNSTAAVGLAKPEPGSGEVGADETGPAEVVAAQAGTVEPGVGE
jgi:hypothetical protein